MSEPRIASVVTADLEGGDGTGIVTKKCTFCSDTLTMSQNEWREHSKECQKAWEERIEARKTNPKLLPLEQQVRDAIPDVDALPTTQTNLSFRGEDMEPWAPNSIIGVIVLNHHTRTASGIIIPADASDMAPGMAEVLAKAHVCRIITVTDNLTVDAQGNYIYPKLAEVKENIEDKGMLGPLVKYMAGGGKVFPDSEGKACILIDARYILAAIKGSYQLEESTDGTAATNPE